MVFGMGPSCGLITMPPPPVAFIRTAIVRETQRNQHYYVKTILVGVHVTPSVFHGLRVRSEACFCLYAACFV